MEDVNQDVNEAAQATAVQQENENGTNASEGVTTQETVISREAYENVKKSMQEERAAKKALKEENARLKAQLEGTTDKTTSTSEEAKVEILYLMNKDPFVKDNLDLIEERMSEDGLTVQEAVKELKSELFDKIHTEVVKQVDVPPKQLITRSVQETRETVVKDAIDGKLENADPRQLEAYKSALARLG